MTITAVHGCKHSGSLLFTVELRGNAQYKRAHICGFRLPVRSHKHHCNRRIIASDSILITITTCLEKGSFKQRYTNTRKGILECPQVKLT